MKKKKKKIAQEYCTYGKKSNIHVIEVPERERIRQTVYLKKSCSTFSHNEIHKFKDSSSFENIKYVKYEENQ